MAGLSAESFGPADHGSDLQIIASVHGIDPDLLDTVQCQLRARLNIEQRM
jgi:hypothetical protein